ncbi:MAG: divalent-cation tolerance protein CutA [Nitrospiraceae bacterium]
MARKTAPGLVVFVTSPTRREATRIGKTVVGERLAACATLLGLVDSIYWWKGKVTRGREVLLVLKTTSARYGELEARITSLHSYEVPEIVALPIGRGYPPYLKWLAEETCN